MSDKFIDTGNGLEFALTVDLYCEGFRCALGTSEPTCDGHATIKCSPNLAYRYDVNNGVLVVYDDIGAPWIAAKNEVSTEKLDELIVSYGLRLGAYVPHSNDNGHFAKTGILSGVAGYQSVTA